jgi:hypothetical protein
MSYLEHGMQEILNVLRRARVKSLFLCEFTGEDHRGLRVQAA